MKARLMTTVITILVAGMLVAGGTMAWFTDEAEAEQATFKAGTLEIETDGAYIISGPDNMNWNPGDENTVEWDIYNVGSKDIELRVSMEGEWTFLRADETVISDPVAYFDAFDAEEDIYENISFELALASGDFDPDDWDFAGEHFYYLDGPIEAGDVVTLSFDVALAGRDTGNEYQRAEYELGGIVEAVQASNEAPSDLWGQEWDDLQ